MPSASLSGRLAIGAGTLGMAFVATAGLTAPAQAIVHRAAGHRQPPAVLAVRHLTTPHLTTPHLTTQRLTRLHLTVLRPTAPAAPARRARHVDRARYLDRERAASRAGSAAPPRVSSDIPAEGAPGWPVTLVGSRFRHITSVSFGGTSTTFTVTSRRRISTVVPAGATSGPITVTGTAGTGRSRTFAVTPAETLEPGETLPATDRLSSKDGHFTLAMQGDGNLVYFVAGSKQTLWASFTAGNPGAYLTMLDSGNLVMYSASGARILWASKAAGHGPARLVAQTNGNLAAYEGSSRTWVAGSFDNKLKAGEVLRPGWFLSSGNGYKLVMRRDGNLAESGATGARWSSGTAGHPGAVLVMRSNGNLAVRAGGTTLWSSRTAGHPGARLIVQRSGVLAVRGQGRVLWASKGASAAPVTTGQWPGRAGTAAAARYFGYPYPHAPACTHGGACDADKWAFYQGQCTSWVAYRLNEMNGISFSNFYGGTGRWGDAVGWAAHARALKIAVTATPTLGAVAWYGSTKAAPDGHVAYVEQVNSPTSIVMSEMNYDADNGFWVHTITKATGDWPSAFIHLAGR